MRLHRCLPSARAAWLALSILLTVIGANPVARAQFVDQKSIADNIEIAPAPTDANDLSMEVNTLRTLYLLRGTVPATDAQTAQGHLRNIKRIFDPLVKPEKKKRQPAEISNAYRKALGELRASLVRASLIDDQDEQIERLDKKVQDLQNDEEPTLDDQVQITEAARKATPNFVKTFLTADQVVSYLGSYGKDLPNPRNLMMRAMFPKEQRKAQGISDARSANLGAYKKLSPEEWKEMRAFTIREVTWQVGGLNIDKAEADKIGKQIGAVLDKSRAMNQDELVKNSLELKGLAFKITDKVGPTDFIKHLIEQDVAEMLSNPRLIPAVDACLMFREDYDKARKAKK